MLDVVDIGAFVYMFMEYCPGGDLLEYILSKGHLSIKRTKHIFRYTNSHYNQLIRDVTFCTLTVTSSINRKHIRVVRNVRLGQGSTKWSI